MPWDTRRILVTAAWIIGLLAFGAIVTVSMTPGLLGSPPPPKAGEVDR